MALICPQCSAAMREVSAPATVGYCILLDQCAGCGGIWCDRWELYPLDAAAAAQLDAVDEAALATTTAATSATLDCPRCQRPLTRLSDASLPPNTVIHRCTGCDGMWLNRGMLRRVKSRPRPHGEALEAHLERLRRSLKDWPTVQNLDAAMAASPNPENDDDTDWRRELAYGGAWLVLRLLLRLILGL